MAHSVFRFKESLTNTPLFATPFLVDHVFDYLNSRDLEGFIPLASTNLPLSPSHVDTQWSMVPNTNIAVVPIEGPITFKASWVEPLCGGASYETLTKSFEEIADKGIKTVVMSIDSGGGMAHGMTETGRWIRKFADDNGIHVIAYADGYAASAAYGMASAAHELYANADSEVGSIGVVVKLRNINKALKEAGIEDTYIFRGKEKIPFNKEGEWKQSFLDQIDEGVEEAYEEFVSYVAEMRGIEQETVRNTEASLFSAKKALELGLIDSVMTRSDFFTHLAKLEEKESKPMFFPKQKSGNQMELDELKAAYADLESKHVLSATALEAANAALEAAVVNSSALEAEVEKYKAEALALNEQAAANAVVEAQAKATARKERLVASLGAEKGETLAVSLESLSDEAFALVAEGYEAQAKALANADVMTQELGVGAEGEGEVVDGVQAALKQLKIIK